ncbi:S1 family peptidase [Nocardia suismassiliense]|uniref:S1 family peptidase n=1 Tax=Nocardia suismassiliense TaxID=2077092 RepID=UPI00131EE141|nr:S1 family peptidase [Nocardia suismassiliense]
MSFGPRLRDKTLGRGTALRRCRQAALMCCVALAAGSAAVPVSAAPPSGAISLPPSLIDALGRDLGIDAAEYARRVALTTRLSEFARSARIAHPAAFAGVRMDGGRPIVSLTDGVSSRHARAAAEAAGFTVETVSASEATLRERRAAFERWLAAQTGAVAESIFGYGIDLADNSFAVRVAKDTQLPAEAGPVRAIAATMPETWSDNTADEVRPIAAEGPDDAIVGGQSYAFEVDGEVHRCSFGFHATDAKGRAVNITAGHCDPNNLVAQAKRKQGPQRVFTVRGTSDKEYVPGEKPKLGTELGYFEVSSFSPYDYGILRINEAAAPRFRNNLVSAGELSPPTRSVVPPTLDTGSNTSQVPDASIRESGVVPIDGTADPIDGAVVCKAGFRSGYSCGVVLASGQVARLKGVPGHGDPVQFEDMFITTLCGHQGDSGGPIMAGTKAVGITSSIVTTATLFDGTCGHLPVLLGQPLSRVLRDHPGLKVRTS